MLAQMTGAGSRARIWLESFGRRPLALSSPYPVAECLQRLAAVTASRGPTRWYLDSRTALRPDPLFKGEFYQSRTRLTRFADMKGSRRSPVWLEVRLDPQAGEGTALSGWIGRPAGAFEAALFVVFGGVASLGLLAAGIFQLEPGHIIGLLPLLASPLPAAVFPRLYAHGRGPLESDIAKLVQAVNEVLGSTAAL
jgi:hypothetical protein